jgi:hypothetical protein
MPTPDNSYRTIFTFNRVPVKARPSFWPMILGVWLALVLARRSRHPAEPPAQTLWAGKLSMLLLLVVDIGHALAHTVSARWAGAPMDEIRLEANMPRTIYYSDDVTPRQHCQRAIGGPIFNAIGMLGSLAWWSVAKRGSLSRELAGVSSLGHGLIFAGSLLPLPFFDGGVLLKWSLVARGLSPEEADSRVRQANLGLGDALPAAGARLTAQGRKLLGNRSPDG